MVKLGTFNRWLVGFASFGLVDVLAWHVSSIERGTINSTCRLQTASTLLLNDRRKTATFVKQRLRGRAACVWSEEPFKLECIVTGVVHLHLVFIKQLVLNFNSVVAVL